MLLDQERTRDLWIVASVAMAGTLAPMIGSVEKYSAGACENCSRQHRACQPMHPSEYSTSQGRWRVHCLGAVH